MSEGKSTVDEIRRRFDQEVERFANLSTGQTATVDAPLVLELIARAAAATNPAATHALDIGCGAGNYSLKLLERLPHLRIDLLDLSLSMLSRAKTRIAAVTSAETVVIQTDIRDVALDDGRYDIIIAAAVLHHLRTDDEWEHVISKLYRALKAGGSLWISDLIEHSNPAVHELMWERYGEYLAGMKDTAYRDLVYSYIDREDTPRPLMYQLDLLRRVGFRTVDILHKNSTFAAFGGIK